MTGQQPDRLTFLDAVVDALRQAGVYNKEDQAAPVAILWPDRERQWLPLLTRLRAALPVLTLGPYDPDSRTGPAYWIRYALGSRSDFDFGEAIPVVYLPGVSRSELRAVEECPRPLQPLAELQYRGVFWTHRNGRDWTVAAFLQSADGGLGVEVGADAATREALLRTLEEWIDLPVSRLTHDAPLRAQFFHEIAIPDEARSILEWLDDPTGFRQAWVGTKWETFRAQVRQGFGVDPEREGEVTAAQHLGRRDGRWATVWDRFREAPTRYPNLPDLLRRARPEGSGQLPLDLHLDSWPQENEAAERQLRDALTALAPRGAIDARERIAALEREHGARRGWVWADIGQAQLASALGHLATLAEATERVPAGATLDDVVRAYTEWGWQADAAVLDALAAVEASADIKAVTAAIGAVYRPWLEMTANAFQTAFVASGSLPVSPHGREAGGSDGVCLLFADGLRFDAAHRLADLPRQRGLACAVSSRLGALPGVTPTAKPAVSPVAHLLGPGTGFDTVVRATGAKITADTLRKQLIDEGWQVLRGDETGDPTGKGWTEAGAIDSYGHRHEWKLAHYLPPELRAIAGRVAGLLAAGWQRVEIVTDHGWLLLPGGLPKVDLPEHLTVQRKGRCARLKADATTDEQTVPWAWDSQVRMAVARGIGCYEAGKEYEHGGLSPQECVVPVLTVTAATQKARPATIGEVVWRGLRCAVKTKGAGAGFVVDIRTKAGDPTTSIAAAPKAPGADGRASLVVEDEDRQGDAVHIVLLDDEGRIMAQTTTSVGG